jgi:hypothetical protein
MSFFCRIVSWNFKHIVNYKTIKGVKAVSLMEGYKDVAICTPTMLLDLENQNERIKNKSKFYYRRYSQN